jgi:hypothetical protein
VPERLRLSRGRGSQLRPGAVPVARCGKCAVCRPEHPTRRPCWGNPHQVDVLGRDEAVRRYRLDLHAGRLPYTVADVVRDLAGRDLACWCPLDLPCHADALLAAASPATRRSTR